MSETVIILACVLGALAVMVIVCILIYCISNPNKDHVTTLRPRRQREIEIVEVPARRMHMPKPPPPYSDAPPAYEAIDSIDVSNCQPHVLPNHPIPSTSRQNSSRSIRVGRATPHPSGKVRRPPVMSASSYNVDYNSNIGDNRKTDSQRHNHSQQLQQQQQQHDQLQAQNYLEQRQREKQQQQQQQQQHQYEQQEQNEQQHREQQKQRQREKQQREQQRQQQKQLQLEQKEEEGQQKREQQQQRLREQQLREQEQRRQTVQLDRMSTVETVHVADPSTTQEVKVSHSIIRRLSEKHKVAAKSVALTDEDNDSSTGVFVMDTGRNERLDNDAGVVSGLLTMPASPVPNSTKAAARSAKRQAILEKLQKRQEMREDLGSLYMI